MARAGSRPGFGVAALLIGVTVSGCGRTGERYAVEVVRAVDQGKVTATRSDMETIGRALAAVTVDRGGYPAGASIQDAMGAIVPAQMRAAVTADAWGRPFDYRSDGRTYTLASAGADGAPGTDDDLILNDGQFTSLPAPPR
jgi:hypothetical protein